MSVARSETLAAETDLTERDGGQPHSPAHPTPCPSWCAQRRHPVPHQSDGARCTAHATVQHELPNPRAFSDEPPSFMRAELYRLDETGETGETLLLVTGESDAELTGPEVDVLIAQVEAFAAALRVLRRQMG